jgi:hypothetical protein
MAGSRAPEARHRPLRLFIRNVPGEAEGSAVSLSLAAEAEEENCRSLGFARDDKKERAVEKSGVVTKGESSLEMEF